MKNSMFAAASAALALVIGVVGAAVPAAAAPPTAPWSASAGGDVASVTATAVGLDLAGLGVAVSSAQAGSTASPRAVSSSSNISAAAAGLPIAVSTNSVSAPPDAAPETDGIAASVTGLVDVGAITTTNEAHWGLDAACVTSGVLSSATTQVAGLGVLPAIGGGVVSLGVSQSTGTTSLAQNSGLNYGVRSVGSGTITGLSILGGEVTVAVAGETTLTATASGTSTGTVAYAPASVTVTSDSGTVTLTPAAPSTTINLALGSVTVGLNTPTQTTTATSASASVALLTVDVRLPAAPLPAITDVSVDVLPLTASATAPAGGIDCPPPAPVVVAPADGSATADSTPTISGTAVAGATVTPSIDGTALPTTTADGGGNWSTVAPVLADGSHTVSATQTVNGQLGPVSNTNTFTVDTVAPVAPTVVTPANGSVTTDSTPDIIGTAVPDSIITVSIDGTPLGTTTTANAQGDWSLTAPALADGSHTVSAVAADAVGNTSPPSNTNTFTVDTTAPAAPIVVTPANGSVTSDSTPDITGTAVPDSIITVSIDGTPLPTTTSANAQGDWSLTAPALADGSHTVNAVAADAVGNTSPPSNTNTFTVDTAAPVAPLIESPENDEVVDTATPAITGTAEANATVTVLIDGTTAGTTTADGTGAWAFTPSVSLAEGPHTVVATATDIAGNVSPESNEVAFTVDTVVPAAPVIESPENDDIVATATPPITGSAETGSTVTVIIDGTTAGTTTADGTTGDWSFTPTALAQGQHTVVATASDAAGNVSPDSNEVTFTVDTVAPLAPVIESPVTGDVVNTTTPAISGMAEPGATVTVDIDGTTAGTTTADGTTGAWSFTPSPLAQGDHTVVATATDAAGNVSPDSNEVAFTVDTVAPPAPVITDPENGDVVGTPTPQISGTSEVDALIMVRIDGAVAGNAVADGTGNWSLTPSVALTPGSHTVVARAADAAGNVSPDSNTVTFSVDTAAPPAPVITDPETGDVVDDATPQISGTAEANATVEIQIDGASLGTTTASSGGDWTFTPTTPLSEGSHTVVATARDAGGNVSPGSAPVTFIVDTVDPAAPTIDSPSAGEVVDTATPEIAGDAEADSTVTVVIDGTTAGTTTAGGTGDWTFTPSVPLSEGPHTVVATAADAAGNVSPPSNEVTFTVDTIAPPAPVITEPGNGDVVATPTPGIQGTAEANATVTVVIDDTAAGTTTASATGDWTFTPAGPLADGSHTVVATATDAAGNISAPSNTVTFTVDTIAPPAPVITEPGNGDVVATPTPGIQGTAEGNATVTVVIDGTTAGTTTASPTGAWTFTPAGPLADGSHTVVATATDAAGNVSAPSNTVTFTVDATPPSAPAITSPAEGDVLDTATPVIGGSAEADALVTVIIDGVPAGTTTANATGDWSFTPAPLADGPHTVTATATDAAGNVSPEAAEVGFTVDTTAPAAPVVTAPAAGSTTNDPTPTITGTAEPASTVTVLIDGVTVGTANADAGGAWSFPVPDPLSDGAHTVAATATDGAGNTGPQSEPITFVVDTTAPAAPVITSPAPGSTTDDATPPIAGTAEPGSTVTVIVDGEPIGTTTADGNGAWTFTPTTPLGDGEHTITATATDAAGNTGPESAPVTVTIDAPGPADVVLTLTPASQTVASGAQGVLTATVRNTGESTATNVVVALEIPAGFTDYSGVATSWPDGQAQPPDGVVGSLTFAVGDLAPGQSVVYRISGTVAALAGSTLAFTGTATQTQTDPSPADNSAQAQIVVAASGALPATGGSAPLGGLLPAGMLLVALGLAAVVLGARRRIG